MGNPVEAIWKKIKEYPGEGVLVKRVPVSRRSMIILTVSFVGREEQRFSLGLISWIDVGTTRVNQSVYTHTPVISRVAWTFNCYNARSKLLDVWGFLPSPRLRNQRRLGRLVIGRCWLTGRVGKAAMPTESLSGTTVRLIPRIRMASLSRDVKYSFLWTYWISRV